MVQNLDTWLSSLDAHAVRKGLEEMEERAQGLAVRHRQIEDELAKLREQIEKARGALALKERFEATLLPNVVSGGHAGGFVEALAAGRPAPGRESIRAVLEAMPEVRVWSPRRMLNELRKRGWTDAEDAHAVQVAMARMAREGEFRRPQKGLYLRGESDDSATVPLRLTPEEGGNDG